MKLYDRLPLTAAWSAAGSVCLMMWARTTSVHNAVAMTWTTLMLRYTKKIKISRIAIRDNHAREGVIQGPAKRLAAGPNFF